LSTIEDATVGQYGAVLHVAGWFGVDTEKEWPTLLPWLEPFDTEKSKSRAHKFHLLISDNDRFTSDYEGNKIIFEEKLGAHVSIISGANHFNTSEEQNVLDMIGTMLH
jgi:predicted alpha/beta hydrolase family esterase